MKIYTKTGDKGKTSTYSGGRRPKSDLMFHVIGNIDFLGVMIAESLLHIKMGYWSSFKSYFMETEEMKLEKYLKSVQNTLFKINSIIATTKSDAKVCTSSNNTIPKKVIKLSPYTVTEMEIYIDYMTIGLPKLTNFILPNSAEMFPVIMHKIRAHSRLVERMLTEYNTKAPGVDKIDPIVQKYINRLSDLFFTIARYYNHIHGNKEVIVEIN